MTPYKITSATLTTYSGRRHTIDVESEYMTESLRKVKERMLDWFTSKIKSSDPFVKIELKQKKCLAMKIETKYEIGQEVWVMTIGRPFCTTITAIHIDKNGLSYCLKSLVAREEERIFPTKEELLKSL